MSAHDRSKGEAPAPGELDGLVLSYLAEHKGRRPVNRHGDQQGIGRSAGAVANCVARLAKEKKVRQAKKRPRAYVVKEAK